MFSREYAVDRILHNKNTLIGGSMKSFIPPILMILVICVLSLSPPQVLSPGDTTNSSITMSSTPSSANPAIGRKEMANFSPTIVLNSNKNSAGTVTNNIMVDSKKGVTTNSAAEIPVNTKNAAGTASTTYSDSDANLSLHNIATNSIAYNNSLGRRIGAEVKSLNNNLS